MAIHFRSQNGCDNGTFRGRIDSLNSALLISKRLYSGAKMAFILGAETALTTVHSKKRCVNLTHLFVQILTHLKVGFKTRLKVCLTHPKLGFTTHLKVCLTHVKVC